VLITAVDAHTGESVVVDRNRGVGLVEAVAASCASDRPYTIGDNRCIRRRLPMQRERRPGSRIRAGAGPAQLAAQIDELRARGSRVERIFPDSNFEHMSGANAICRCVRPLLEPATTKAEPLPSRSPNSGTDATVVGKIRTMPGRVHAHRLDPDARTAVSDARPRRPLSDWTALRLPYGFSRPEPVRIGYDRRCSRQRNPYQHKRFGCFP
jgi:hypothetical protein